MDEKYTDEQKILITTVAESISQGIFGKGYLSMSQQWQNKITLTTVKVIKNMAELARREK